MTETRPALTKKQRRTLDYITSFIEQHGYSPSYREIANGLKLNSVATVAQHIDSLVGKGLLQKVIIQLAHSCQLKRLKPPLTAKGSNYQF